MSETVGDTFAALDSQKAALRLLMMLYEHPQGIRRMELKKKAHEQEIGGTAFYAALNILKDHELVIDIPWNQNGKRIIVTTLRFRGRKAAGILYQLKEYLSTDEGLKTPRWDDTEN